MMNIAIIIFSILFTSQVLGDERREPPIELGKPLTIECKGTDHYFSNAKIERMENGLYRGYIRREWIFDSSYNTRRNEGIFTVVHFYDREKKDYYWSFRLTGGGVRDMIVYIGKHDETGEDLLFIADGG